MTLGWPSFVQQRKAGTLQFFPCPGATRTVMVCSHIWWTEQIAFAIRNAGFNLLLHPPLYLLYTSDEAFGKFDAHWNTIIQTLRQHQVDLVLGGNSAAMAVHPKTGEMIHDAAAAAGRKITLVNWWWDEVRNKPPLERAGISPEQFVKLLANPATINAIWDLDVMEELQAGLGLKNLMHLPLATLPEHWPLGFLPLEKRPLAACFLGNCHYTSHWIETDDDPLMGWARRVLRLKIGDSARPMQKCIDEIGRQGGIPKNSRHFTGDPWIDFQKPWELLNGGWMHFTRNKMIQAAAKHLQGNLALIGKGWDQLGLHASLEHAGDKSGYLYAQSQISLNLFGGCVHGGMPLRPYDIGASGGLIVTHDQRELPALFEPGKECLAFRTESEMLELLDRVRAQPAAYNGVAQAGRRRVRAQHTWSHRIAKLMQNAAN